ncbi:hypothetical protein IEN85_22305 [Pelagicoccus sp. NFK12]|uniref:Uncharacterized protein n=1 Tax=Pelagicoccus enzymogenes TaxID=2773457 RepID=A0A927IJX5_9BACT|nr:hypothetical protein [Pelagicoccus enzymogenes]MBD5782248.1 hypothetical protein [Pelagicoccus enzymogenes]
MDEETLKNRISSSTTKGLAISYYVYLALITIGLIIHPDWPLFIFAIFAYAIVSFLHFTFFSKLCEVRQTDEGLEIVKKGIETRIRYDEIISIERNGTWFVPVCVFTEKYESFYFLTADFPMTDNNGIVKNLRDKIMSNQTSLTTPDAARPTS